MRRFTRPIDKLTPEKVKSPDGLSIWDYTYLASTIITSQPVGIGEIGEFFFRGWLFYFDSDNEGKLLKVYVEKGKTKGKFELVEIGAKIEFKKCYFHNSTAEISEEMSLFLSNNIDYVKKQYEVFCKKIRLSTE